MQDEIVVFGSGKQPDGWLTSVLSECPYRLRFVQVPKRPVAGVSHSPVGAPADGKRSGEGQRQGGEKSGDEWAVRRSFGIHDPRGIQGKTGGGGAGGAPPGGVPAGSEIVLPETAQACILQEDLDLAGWTKVLWQDQKGAVLWAVSRLDQDIVCLLDGSGGVKGILTSNADPLAVLCCIKTAVSSWKNELLYRRRAEKAFAELNNRKLIERAKGILMDRFALSEAEAYGRIRREAMRNRKSMVQIAESILLLQDLTDMSG